MTPKRIQRKRARGWRKPAGVVNITRRGKWGNPFAVRKITHKGRHWWIILSPDGDRLGTFNLQSVAIDQALILYRNMLDRVLADEPDALDELRGKDLMCFCAVDDPCHGDILLELANRPKE